MTFIELILLMEQRGEKIISDKSNSITTDKHLYSRISPEQWEERELPPIDISSALTLAPQEPPLQPKKKTTSTTTSSNSPSISDPTAPPKRKRGRPRKNPL